MHEKQNRILKFIALVGAIWALYIATFATDGRTFDPSFEPDVISYRFGVALGNIAEDAEDEVIETNYKMQQVADGRNDLNDRRVERDTKPAD